MIAPSSKGNAAQIIARIRERRPRTVELAMLQYIAQGDQFRGAEDALGLAQQSLDAGLHLKSAAFDEFMEVFHNRVVRLGAGSEFRSRKRLLSILGRCARERSAAGLSAMRYYLRQAEYLATISDGGDDRRRALQRAVVSAKSDAERVEASLWLGKYYVDASKYRRAVRTLDSAAVLASGSNAGFRFLSEIKVAKAIGLYASGLPSESTFLEAIGFAKSVLDPKPNLALAQAHHYLGRIRIDAGRLQEGIDLLVQGQRYKELVMFERRPFGYYNLRLAEALLAGSALELGEFHIRLAEEQFKTVQESSNAQAELYGAHGRLSASRNESAEALESFRRGIKAARAGGNRRTELGLRLSVIRLHMNNGLRGAALANAVGMIVPSVAEAAGIGNLEKGAMFIIRQIRRLNQRGPAPVPDEMSASRLTCPCSFHSGGEATVGVRLFCAPRPVGARFIEL